ncbi:NAD(P)-dependent oxidoreductase [Sphingobium boeckii]|uniref:3-hydroxyisobutyrate dehydrogenase-like beta-hydroxyacid dehydrogenase n=1 Tax=Sphingobium boeckii TaxID=1082345 RepID=A0A7W9AI84_9SPHN|nr:NAD(P)-dependent oxidoreductase [Sphingobium boeckii]MBB5685944.1 3-hydroxyisobutyrate dehydrogenase-like beta-hydroxyacid dehydrogenase [Sphingobium boeckii]
MTQDHETVVGFVGLGSQGGAMARRIVDAGFPLLLWARRPEALEAYADTAAETVSDLAAMGSRADHVGICVVDDAGTREVVTALLATMRPGSRIAIHSTVHPDTCIALAAQAQAGGVDLIDAPVSGGGQGAADGTLTVMVGGETQAVAAARPVFETFARLIAHLGGVGAGQLAKLVNNALMAANMALADAALSAGASLGLEKAALIDLVKASSGRSFGFEVRARLPDIALFGHGAKLLAKDVGLLKTLLSDEAGFAILDGVAEPFLDRIARAQPQGE